MEPLATAPVLMKNIPKSEVFSAQDLVEYQEGQVVSRTICQTKAVTMTLFAFWQGEGISSHTVPGDALVQVLDGEAAVTIAGTEYLVAEGQSIVMPAGSPHGLEAKSRFKMLLTLVK
ncbi:MAG: cupin domain-containing protein [Desulfovibrio sp.]|nr:MAG: cupin domain-containing protein [Desulfovibrio sp.]